MEATGEGTAGILEKIIPPRLEDAGLEDCALPPDSIHEAFLKAASAVRRSIFSHHHHDDCVNDPGDHPKDALVDVATESGTCGGVTEVAVGDKAVEDAVVDPDVAEEAKACVDGLQGLEISGREGENDDKDSSDVGDDEDEKGRPTLAEIGI